jgi:hypothetical protein
MRCVATADRSGERASSWLYVTVCWQSDLPLFAVQRSSSGEWIVRHRSMTRSCRLSLLLMSLANRVALFVVVGVAAAERFEMIQEASG